MIPLASLWMPILLAAFLVFFASALIHMALRWHNAEYRRLPNEEVVRSAIRSASLPPGQYLLPYCVEGKEVRTAEMQQKFKDGPVGMLTLRANGMPNMGVSLGSWFVCTVVVAALVACLAAVALPAGANPKAVFHVTGLATLLAYLTGSVVNAIWMGRPWFGVALDALDSLLYAGLTGAAFAWLWPA